MSAEQALETEMSYWEELDQSLEKGQKELLLKCFTEKISASKASESVGVDQKIVTQFYLKAQQACWLHTSCGDDCITSDWLYKDDKNYLFFRLFRETKSERSKVYIERYSPEPSTFDTYKKRQTNSGWIYLMRPGKHVSSYPEDHHLYKPPRADSHLDPYLWGLVGLNVSGNLILKPTGLRRKTGYGQEPPIIKNAYLQAVSEMKTDGTKFEEFSLIFGEQLLRFSRTSKRVGFNEELFCHDIKEIFRQYSTMELDSAF